MSRGVSIANINDLIWWTIFVEHTLYEMKSEGFRLGYGFHVRVVLHNVVGWSAPRALPALMAHD